MFRDLSDKLFTREIIELHEKQGEDCEHCHGEKHELSEHGNSSVPSGKASPTSLGSEIRTAVDSKKASNKPALKDLGKFILNPIMILWYSSSCCRFYVSSVSLILKWKC